MGRYTLKGSPALDARIDADMARIADTVARSPHAPLYRAIVLLGGYGRGEGTPFLRDGREEPFNDYDLVVVARAMPRGKQAAVRADLKRLEEQLTREVGLPVDLCLYLENRLPCAEFSLLNYEMKYGHRVVWGDAAILGRMPDYPHDAIPFSEGTRLLLNRGKLLLDIHRAVREGKDVGDEERIKYIKFLFKALLAFGDCTLLICHEYDLRYAEKVKRIERCAATAADLPDPRFLVDGYRQAVAFKKWTDVHAWDGWDWRRQFEAVRRYYLEFFRWYEARRLQAPAADSGAHALALARRGRECGTFKAMALNLQLFRGRALENGVGLFLTHPRARLYLALPLLLSDNPPAGLIRRLLSAPNEDCNTLEQTFYRLHRRLS